jgi:hypothetical protein
MALGEQGGSSRIHAGTEQEGGCPGYGRGGVELRFGAARRGTFFHSPLNIEDPDGDLDKQHGWSKAVKKRRTASDA